MSHKWIALLVLLAVHTVLLAWSATRHSPTIDEVAHLPAGISHWYFGRFDLYRVNPPLVRLVAALPVLAAHPRTDWSGFSDDAAERSEFLIGRRFIRVNGTHSRWLFTLARWACIPFSVLGAIICFVWSRALFGWTAGFVAAVMWCFCPNIVGHGALITPDVAAASFGAAACWTLRCWLHSGTLKSASVAGITLGMALLTKTTWLVLVPLVPVYALLVCCRSRPKKAETRPPRWIAQSGYVLLSALFLINAVYGFERSLSPLGEFQFISSTLSGRSEPYYFRAASGNKFAGTWIGSLRVPLPGNYLSGIDVQKADFETERVSYVRGEFRTRGWWWYYLYAFAVKVPIGILLMLSLAIVLAAWSRYRSSPLDETLLLLPALSVIILVSSQTAWNHHLRYILPAFPFLFISASRIGSAIFLKGALFCLCCTGAILWAVLSSLSVYPHNLSYFNEFVGGPSRGPEHLLDSNIDWGQDLFFLIDWLAEHPEARPLGLVYYGLFHPRDLGVKYTAPPIGLNPARAAKLAPLAQKRIGPWPGWYAVSVNAVYGYRLAGIAEVKDESYAYFSRFQPVAMAGYSIYIYHITLEDANRVRRELALSELTQTDVQESVKRQREEVL